VAGLHAHDDVLDLGKFRGTSARLLCGLLARATASTAIMTSVTPCVNAP